MRYNVSRGLREIVAPRQTMPTAQWQRVKLEFDSLCVFCGSAGTKENRGIVPDHLIPVTRFGELVIGNTVPACQTCNDSRGDGDWRPFVRERYPTDPEAQIARIEAYLKRHPYHPPSPESALSPKEQKEYAQLLHDWETLLERARRLDSSAKARRKRHARG
jgi:hypothetical protein